jgi:hypothetical protein
VSAGDWLAIGLLLGGAVCALVAVRLVDARRYGRHS